MIHPPIYVPALFAQMGDWKYYSAVMRIADVCERINFAEHVNQIRSGKQLSDLIQRALTRGRSNDISDYLLGNKDRFFNSLVVAVYGGNPTWRDFDIQAAQRRSANVPEWVQNAFGLLHLDGNEQLFPLDGQHRLSGLQHAIAIDPAIGEERISVLFVSHHTDDVGRARTRKLFTTLNKTAKNVSKSDIIALDETDAVAIITRRLVEQHRFFSDGRILASYGTANLSATDSEHFLTIIKLYDLVGFVLTDIVYHFDRAARIKLRYVRPDESTLNSYYDAIADFLETLIDEVSSLKSYFSMSGAKARRVLDQQRHGDMNSLFRSVGLEVFLRVVSSVARIEGGWRDGIKIANKIPKRFTDVPFKDVMYDTSAERIVLGRVRVTRDLILYMLGYIDDESGKLLSKYAAIKGIDVSKARLPRRIRR